MNVTQSTTVDGVHRRVDLGGMPAPLTDKDKLQIGHVTRTRRGNGSDQSGEILPRMQVPDSEDEWATRDEPVKST